MITPLEPYLNAPVLFGLGLASLVMVIASALLTPVILVRLPKDYFKREKPHLIDRIRSEGAGRGFVLVMKNLFAAGLFLAGVLMLFLPGQGLLTMFIGMILMDFPRKMAIERRILALPRILDTVNWLRRKRGHEPLEL